MRSTGRIGALTQLSADGRALLVAAIAVLAVKLVWFAVDHVPLFYMGDSRAYIASSIYHTILTDRSNTYGLLIRLFAVVPRSLTTLVVVQTLAGAATAWLLAVLLLRYFRVRPVIAVSAAAVLATEPLQILHERMVLTEAFTALLFMGYLLLTVSYLGRPRLVMLVAIAATGVLLLSLRLVYVPLTLFAAALIPLLGWVSSGPEWRTTRRARWFLTHLSISVMATLVFHQIYKVAMGRAARLPPAYQYASGFFLVGAWAPLIQPEDATDPSARQVIDRLLAGGRYPLRSFTAHSGHLWLEGGLVSELVKAFDGDRYLADQVARQISSRTLRRAPLAVVRVSASNYTDFWTDLAGLPNLLRSEQGSNKELDPTFLATLKKEFRLDAGRIPSTLTASKRYHLVGSPWYLILTLSPVIVGIAAISSRREARSGMVMMFAMTIILLLVLCIVLPGLGVRVLHPLALITLPALAVIADRAVRANTVATAELNMDARRRGQDDSVSPPRTRGPIQ